MMSKMNRANLMNNSEKDRTYMLNCLVMKILLKALLLLFKPLRMNQMILKKIANVMLK